jgi:hypothetical protein
MKLRCPHCGEDGVSGLRKMLLGPRQSTICKNCSKRVGVPYWSIACSIPLITTFFFIPGLSDNSGILGYMIGVFGASATYFLYGSIVPLVKR